MYCSPGRQRRETRSILHTENTQTDEGSNILSEEDIMGNNSTCFFFICYGIQVSLVT